MDLSREEIAKLREDGYVVVPNVLPPDVCAALRQHVLLVTDEAAQQGRTDLFGNIQEQTCRHDLKLDLCSPVVAALNHFAKRCRGLLEAAVGGNARLVELAAITSSRGAIAQPVHADTMHGVTRFLQSEVQLDEDAQRGPPSEDEDAGDDLAEIVRAVATGTALIFTSLVALQDIDASMGPTHVWPKTNTAEHHATLWGTHVGGKLTVAEAEVVFGVAKRDMLLKQGDLVLYDSRTMHCGGANCSDQRRSVLCISVMGPGIRPDGTTWTMLPSLRNRLSLSNFPLPEGAVTAPTATGCGDVVAALPLAGALTEQPEAPGPKLRTIPPLEEWLAAVRCKDCAQWRPVSVAEAPGFTCAEAGFRCQDAGFTCSQEQGYKTEEIDAMFA